MTIAAGWRLWVPATRERRFQAALAVLLGMHAYRALDDSEKARVDRDLVEIYKPFGIYPWWRFRKDASATALAAARALAMAKLGLPTRVADVDWGDVVHSWHRDNPGQLTLDFRAYSQEADDAIDFLQARGAALEAETRYGKRYMISIRERQDA